MPPLDPCGGQGPLPASRSRGHSVMHDEFIARGFDHGEAFPLLFHQCLRSGIERPCLASSGGGFRRRGASRFGYRKLFVRSTLSPPPMPPTPVVAIGESHLYLAQQLLRRRSSLSLIACAVGCGRTGPALLNFLVRKPSASF